MSKLIVPLDAVDLKVVGFQTVEDSLVSESATVKAFCKSYYVIKDIAAETWRAVYEMPFGLACKLFQF